MKNLCDEGLVPCQSTSVPWSPWKSIIGWRSSLSHPLGKCSSLCLHLELKSQNGDVSAKWEQYLFFSLERNLMFLPVVLMMNPEILSQKSYFLYHYQIYVLHHYNCGKYVYYHCHYNFYNLQQVRGKKGKINKGICKQVLHGWSCNAQIKLIIKTLCLYGWKG